jgi:hypothetical protein
MMVVGAQRSRAIDMFRLDNDLLIIPDEPRLTYVPPPAEWAPVLGPQPDLRAPSGPTVNGRSGSRSEPEAALAAEDRTGEQPILTGEEGCPTLTGGAETAHHVANQCGQCGRDMASCTCDFGV